MTDIPERPADSPDPAALQARFEAEVQVAGIAVSDDDRGPLYAMWVELVPIRERLHDADLALEAEPSFTQKPAQLGAGITLTGPAGGGSA
jgi:hypothetical protein